MAVTTVTQQHHTDDLPFPTTANRRARQRGRSLPYLAVLALLGYGTAAEAQVRYTLAPSAEYTWWDESLFLEDRALYGARLGADFGRLVRVSAYYHRGTDLGVFRSKSGLVDGSAMPFADITTDLTTFGANLMFKLGTGRVVPFAMAGAGVMRFEPAGRSTMELINYRYGGGIQHDIARNVRAQVYVAESRVRLDPSAFTDLAPGTTVATRRDSWTVGASLGFALGGSLDGGGPGTDNWSFASIPIEPFVGRLDWDDGLLDRQVVAGVRSGIDVGPHFGLRGFYWQGRSDGLGERQPLQGYGGEAQFNLSSSLGPAPYLVAGAARLDFEDGFEDSKGMTREDETALVLGGGIGLRLSDQFRLNVAARDYIRAERKFDDVTSLDDLTHNWMLSAGVGFNLGRSRSTRPSRTAAMPDAPPIALPEAPQARVPMTRPHLTADTVPHVIRLTETDSTATGGRVLVIPVPTTGEIYIRYGAGSSAIRMAIPGPTGTDSATIMTPGPTGLSPAEMDELVRRLTAVLERMIEARPLPPRAEAPRPTARPTDDTPTPILLHAPEAEDTPADTLGGGIRLRSVSPFGGLSLGSVTQLAFGVRADAGQFLGLPALRVVPVFALGLGGQASIMAELGLQLGLPTIETRTARLLQPHVRLGVGGLWLTGDGTSRGGLNFSYGVTFDRVGSSPDDGRPRLFVEHQGIDLFGVNRFVVGLTWKR